MQKKSPCAGRENRSKLVRCTNEPLETYRSTQSFAFARHVSVITVSISHNFLRFVFFFFFLTVILQCLNFYLSKRASDKLLFGVIYSIILRKKSFIFQEIGTITQLIDRVPYLFLTSGVNLKTFSNRKACRS